VTRESVIARGRARAVGAALTGAVLLGSCGGGGGGQDAKKSPTAKPGETGPTLSLAAQAVPADGSKPAPYKKSITVRTGLDVTLLAVSSAAPEDATIRVTLPVSGGAVLRPAAELREGGKTLARSVATLKVDGASATRIGDLRFSTPTFESVEAGRKGSNYVLEAPALQPENRRLVVYMKVRGSGT
jgi:hypothetical protein